jgi:hypothetical protein
LNAGHGQPLSPSSIHSTQPRCITPAVNRDKILNRGCETSPDQKIYSKYQDILQGADKFNKAIYGDFTTSSVQDLSVRSVPSKPHVSPDTPSLRLGERHDLSDCQSISIANGSVAKQRRRDKNRAKKMVLGCSLSAVHRIRSNSKTPTPERKSWETACAAAIPNTNPLLGVMSDHTPSVASARTQNDCRQQY